MCAPVVRDAGAVARAVAALPALGELARPAVVWFGKLLDADAIPAVREATFSDVFIGTETWAVVYPVAGFLHEAAARSGRDRPGGDAGLG